MPFDTLKNQLPDYAKDIKLNLSALVADENLTSQQLWGCFLASALASRNLVVIADIFEQAALHLSSEAQNAVKAAAAVMGMNNIYYRFVHLASNSSYQTMQAKLRMNVIANPGVEKIDFELWSLAVSAVNGCGMCIDSHERHLINAGVSLDVIQTAIRIASVVHAASVVIDGEMAMNPQSGQISAA